MKLFLILTCFTYILSAKIKSCSSLCQKCSKIDPLICLECFPKVFFFKDQCYNSCPEGTYGDADWEICRSCDSSCPVCWGPLSSQCGLIPGVRSSVFLLEKEIENYFGVTSFSKEQVNIWIRQLNIVAPNYDQRGHKQTLVNNDVYSIDVENSLPVGSFSKYDTVFIPVPPYLTEDGSYIGSQWIYVKGQWDGKNWHDKWFPKLPSFVEKQGNKEKIYYENNGYWIFERSKWVWKEAVRKEIGDPNEEKARLKGVVIKVSEYGKNYVENMNVSKVNEMKGE